MAVKKNYNSDGRSAEDRTLDKFAELLIEKLETIQADWKKPWFTEGVTASLPKNLSGREYNGMNSMMLMLHAEKEGFKLPVWATFDRITGLNYVKDKQGVKQEAKDSEGNNLPLVSVNKGAKSFPVFITTFTVVDKETKEKIKYDDYRQMTEQDRERYNVYPKLSVYNVFNVEGQTNLKEARPELFKKLQEQNEVNRPLQQEGEMFSFPAIDHMIAENKWICPIKPTYGDSAYYSISKNEIIVPEKKQFKNGESFYSNLAHEMGHSTGAENQLNRLKPSAFGSKEYAREELVAEMSAALVSQRYGMSKTLKEDSLPYLKGWLNSLKEEPTFIKTVLQDVKKASGMINQHIDKVQMELDKAKEEKQETANKVSDGYGSYDIPKWALPYIMNGDASGISDHEQELVDNFLEKNFPDGFIPEVEEGEGKELNLYPAFGERNENALTDRGESPYLAVDTVSVKFGQPGYMENKSDNKNDGYTNETVFDNTKEQMAAKGVPMVELQQDEQPHYHFGR